MMRPNKDRLYIGLFARGGPAKMPGKEDTYHWALLTGPKINKGGDEDWSGIHHAKERAVIEPGTPPVIKSLWEYATTAETTSMLLVRIAVSKIKNIQQLQHMLAEIPLRPEVAGWNCVAWVKEALHEAEKSSALGTTTADWTKIRDTAMWYVEHKKANHRFDGEGGFDTSKPATWDMLTGTELIP